MPNRIALSLIALMALPAVGVALGPHEVVVLVNSNSPRSAAVAEKFASSHGVPSCNTIQLSLPWPGTNTPLTITRAEFSRNIWEPALAVVRERGIEDHILAWIYSVDFPATISCPAPLSITGLTFTRNMPPDEKETAEGSYVSRVFKESIGSAFTVTPSASFDVFRSVLAGRMPLPSMMIGYAGNFGNSVETITARMAEGASAGKTKPDGNVYFITSDDVRSRAREWQFKPASVELADLGVRAFITNGMPPADARLMGVMAGAPHPKPAGMGRFMPGSIGEHLTSFAGVFSTVEQTKLCAWIEAGAVASAGTVTEPLSNWRKFPSAWLFVHYARGCTVIESFYQSVRCPLQLLIVGDPLAAPWSPRDKLTLDCPDAVPDRASGVFKATASVAVQSDRRYTGYTALIDGRTLDVPIRATGNTCEFDIDPSSLATGVHILRVVAYGSGAVRHQSFAERTVIIGETGKEP